MTTTPATTRAVVGILGRRVDELTTAIEQAINALETEPDGIPTVIEWLREALCPPQHQAHSSPTPTSSKPNPST